MQTTILITVHTSGLRFFHADVIKIRLKINNYSGFKNFFKNNRALHRGQILKFYINLNHPSATRSINKNVPTLYHRQQNTLNPQRWQILRRELRYLDSCYVDPVYHKLKTFPLSQAVNQSEASRNYLCKFCNLWGKSYIAAVGTCCIK